MAEKIKRGRAKESASKVTAICLTDELDAWLRDAAKRERKSQSKLVRDGLTLLKQELENEMKYSELSDREKEARQPILDGCYDTIFQGVQDPEAEYLISEAFKLIEEGGENLRFIADKITIMRLNQAKASL